MKQKFTLTIAMMFIAVFSFGQQKIVKNQIKGGDLKVEKRLKKSDREVESNLHDRFSKMSTLREELSLKSTETLKYRNDSVIDFGWDESGSQWIKDYKLEFTYDASGNFIQDLDYVWDDLSGEWEQSYKLLYAYDGNDNITMYTDYEWDGSQWVGDDKEEYSYDNNGNVTQVIEYEWDEGSSQWVAIWKGQLTVESNGTISEDIGYFWDESSSQWVNDFKGEYTYDDDLNQTEFIGYYWDEGWITNYKEEYTYDANGNMLSYVESNWDESSSQWIFNYKQDYTPDVNGRTIVEIDYYWDESSEQWVKEWKSEYTYDANGNPVEEIYLSYNVTSDVFIANSKYTYTYDLSFVISQLIIPSLYWFVPDYSEFITNKPVEYFSYEWDVSGNDWLNDYNGIYYYSEQNTTSVSNIETEISKIYPNPVSDQVTFNFVSNNNKAVFELFDINGRHILSKEVYINEKLSLKNIKSGVYLYNLFLDGKKQTGQLVKE